MSDRTGAGRALRRLVLLAGDDHGDIERVLVEYSSEQVSGTKLHADIQRLAGEHPARTLAAEWLGPAWLDALPVVQAVSDESRKRERRTK